MLRGLLLTLVFASSSLAAGINSNVEFKPVHEALLTKINALAPIEIIAKQPPAPLLEAQPPQPNPQMKWIPGYWAWDREIIDFVWVCGIWRLSPADHQWVAGYWNQSKGWYWVAGYWQLAGSQPLTTTLAPPALPEEKPGNPPNNNSFWAPGYWNYNAAGKNYGWLGGSWQPFDANLIFTPACWQWRPEGYVFIPAFWDWNLETRGVAYDCDAKGTLTPLTTEIIISRLYYCYPDYSIFFWWHWHCCPDFWTDCWCLPPWWGWSGWWTFSWNDSWWLWWWWSHADFPPPFWLLHDVVIILPPPAAEFMEFIEGMPIPIFITDNGVPTLENWLDAIEDITGNRTPLIPEDHLDEASDAADQNLPHGDNNQRPGGTTPPGNVPKPNIGDAVTPNGTAPIPPLPSLPGSIAPIPPRPQVTPPSTPLAPPTQPNYPQDPQNYNPTYPPNYQPEIEIVPPRWNDRPDRPYPQQPRNPNYTPPARTPNYPNYTPPSRTPTYPNYTPPSSTEPNYPNYKPPSSRSPKYPQYTPPSQSPNNQPNRNIPLQNTENLRSNLQYRQQQNSQNRQQTSPNYQRSGSYDNQK